MRAKDLQLTELVSFADGQLSLHGRRLVLHDMNAFALFRKDLVTAVGVEAARRFLVRFGWFWGEADAVAMQRIFKWDNLTEWVRAGARLHSLQGVARTTIQSLEFDPAAGTFSAEYLWYDSAEAEEHLAALGPSSHAVCWILMGYASGYASHCLGWPIYFIEQQCKAKGDPVCSANGRDAASWGDRLESYRPYFQAEDIKGRIGELTRTLRRQRDEIARQRKQLEALTNQSDRSFAEVHSESFRRTLDLAQRAARFDTSILITGESGAGKEVLARHIHRWSGRSKGPFVGINCAALPETLLESELFGHKAGAFTGAVRDHAGLFESAAGGTIFLDEIGDVSPAVQRSLLRVLQEREVRRVGESKARKIDVRVLAATNRDLREAIDGGRFREDLYYRLAVVEIRIPALREHSEDILPLARHFIRRFADSLGRPNLQMDATCLDYLQAYSWPGNVRELENAIERAAVLCRDDLILPDYLPPQIVHSVDLPPAHADALRRPLAAVEQEHIEAVLRSTGGNRARAARILHISTTTLWRKLKGSSGQEAKGGDTG